MVEFELKGVSYRVDQLNARTQFHLTRKLAPVIPALIPLFAAAKNGGFEKAFADGDVAELSKAAEPLADALANMPDEHADYVLNVCMSAISRRLDQGGWTRIWANGVSMDDDMGLDIILSLAVRVLRENLGGFMRGLATSQTASPTSP